MKALRWVIGGLVLVSAVSAVVALCGYSTVGETLCLSGAVPCIACLLLGIECQRGRWSSTPTPSASSRVAPSAASPFPHSTP